MSVWLIVRFFFFFFFTFVRCQPLLLIWLFIPPLCVATGLQKIPSFVRPCAGWAFHCWDRLKRWHHAAREVTRQDAAGHSSGDRTWGRKSGNCPLSLSRCRKFIQKQMGMLKVSLIQNVLFLRKETCKPSAWRSEKKCSYRSMAELRSFLMTRCNININSTLRNVLLFFKPINDFFLIPCH